MIHFRRLDHTEQVLAIARPVKEADDSLQFHERESPREALEALLMDALKTGTRTYVLFSGGRDSSGLLALTLLLARRMGVPDPLPVTIRHPQAEGSSENEWQELVLNHLGLREHHVLEFYGEQAWLGQMAQTSLRRHGLLWPTASHIHGAVLGQLTPGAVITGEGGDMAVSGRRITPLVDAVQALRPRRSLRVALALAKQSRTGHGFTAALGQASPWLTPAGRELLSERISFPTEPLRWNRAIRTAASLRPARMIRLNYIAVVESFGHTSHNPLEHPRFIHALAGAGGWWGLGDRTAMMRQLFGDLLPDAVTARTTKAFFNESRWTERERTFAREWTGEGVDHRYLNAELLRAEWLKQMPSTLSDIHLHAAWLASHGLPLAPDGS